MARKYLLQFCKGCSLNVMLCNCDEGDPVDVVTAIDSRDVGPLVEALREAVDMVADWASYASPYFQEKWDLDGDLAKLRAALQPFTAENNDPRENA